ncbi:hypothetical protein [Azotobacter beijerinckii]|uniref:hypothetical protein n=1 Tax=Azotobacter beijerinckii TaxID=170623 RepID=UPI00295430AD|nr:hypothetical protein [Azotobacter beijerinckii]
MVVNGSRPMGRQMEMDMGVHRAVGMNVLMLVLEGLSRRGMNMAAGRGAAIAVLAHARLLL